MNREAEIEGTVTARPVAGNEAANLAALLAWRARERPDDTAFVIVGDAPSTPTRLSFGALDRGARKVAAALRNAGLARRRIALLHDTGADLLFGLFGVLYAGGVAVTLAPGRSGKALARLDAIFATARPAGILTDPVGRQMILAADENCAFFRERPILCCEDFEDTFDADDAGQLDLSASSQDVAVLQYTSGSTSTPKGVEVTHAGVLANTKLIARVLAATPQDRLVTWAPMFHDMGLVGGVFFPIYAGIESILIPPAQFVRRPALWLEVVTRFGATITQSPGFGYDLCAKRVSDADLEGLDLRSLRIACCGAEPLNAHALGRFSQRFAGCGFRAEALTPVYALAEATLLVTGGPVGRGLRILEVDQRILETEHRATSGRGRLLVSCGPVNDEQSVIIVDPLTLAPCPAGRVGEVWIAGRHVARGYFQSPDTTRETFGAIPAGSDTPHLRTGDLGFIDDGELVVTGRMKDVIIVRGENHYPQDIEATARSAHAATADHAAAAFAVAEHGEPRIVLLQEVDRLHGQSPAPIFDAIRREIAEQHGLALHAIVLVRRGTVPRTTSGKIRRAGARDLYVAQSLAPLASWSAPSAGFPAAVASSEPLPTGLTAPGPLLEDTIAALVRRVLDLPSAAAPSAPLTSLGLDSLTALHLAAELEEALGLRIDLADLFAQGSVDWLVREALKGTLEARPPRAKVIEPVEERFEPFALTDMQQAYWLGRSGLYPLGQVSLHGYAEIDVDELDVARLNLALRALLSRHDMLRAVILPSGEQQVLEPPPDYQVEQIDLRGAPPEVLAGIRRQMSHEVLPLDRAPPFRIVAAQLHGHTRLHLSVDGSFVDFRSGQVLVAELLALYADPDVCLPPLPPERSFRGYVLAAAAQRATPTHERAEAYWRERLEWLPPPPELPLQIEPCALGAQVVESRAFCVPRDQIARLQSRLTAEGVSEAAFLLTAYAEVVAAWSRAPHFTLNVPVMGRRLGGAEWTDTIGNFSNFVLVAIDATTPVDLLTRSRRVQEELLGAIQHSSVSGVELLRRLSRRDGATPGLGMPVVFTHFPGEPGAGAGDLGAVRQRLGQVRHLASQTPQVWLDNLVVHQSDGIHVIWEFVADLFPTGLVDAMFAAYRDLVLSVAEEPDRLLQTFDLLPPDQKRQRETVNDTARPVPDLDLHELLVRQAQEAPLNLSVVAGSTRFTYRELLERANAVSAWLVREGVQPGDHVVVAMEKGWEQVAAVFGILGAGGVCAPLDVDVPDQRLERLIARSGATIVATQVAIEARLSDLLGDSTALLAVDRLAPSVTAPERPHRAPGEAAYLIHTSGSTGDPKGVLLSHRALMSAVVCTNRRFGLRNDDRVLSVTGLHHDMCAYDIFGLVAAGGAIVLPEPQSRRDPEHWVRLLRDEGITVWNSVPAAAEMLLTYAEARGGVRLPRLRRMVLGGDWTPLDLPARLEAISPAQVVSVGGPTETTLWNIWHPVGEVDPSWRSIPYGRPIDNARYHILDDALRDRPVWVTGEMYCSGLCLALGYFNDSEATEARFRAHPVTGERMYRTGDLGRYRPDGEIEFMGRADLQMKVRGHRVEPAEVEAVLLKHPAVAAAVALATGPRGAHELAAVVVAANERILGPGELDSIREHVRAMLPPHMVPSKLQVAGSLPLTSTGKVDRRALEELFDAALDPAPPAASGMPASESETRLSELFCEIVGGSPPDPDRNLFELGANSLHAVQLQLAIARHFPKPVSVTDIFRHPTLRQLAMLVSQHEPQSGHVQTGRARGLSRLAARGGLRTDVAIVGMALRFPGAVDPAQFWSNLAAGVESIEDLQTETLLRRGVDPTFLARPDYVARASRIAGADLFDPDFFNMTAREAAITDPQQRLLLECAYDALTDAGKAPRSLEERVGVFVGAGYGTYLVHNLPGEFDVLNFDAAVSLPVLIGNDKDYAATRIAYKLNLRGPAMSLGSACSSSLLAIREACEKLISHECDYALAGGAKLCAPDDVGYLHQPGSVQSSDGRCRPFDAEASGTVFGSGVAMVALRRLQEAVADGDAIYAVIRGGAANNDGAAKISYTAPSVQGQVEVLAEAHAAAEVDPATVSFVEAHGTGTALGDPIEVAALNQAFGRGTPGSCALGSVKGNLGHLDAAAGVAGLIKTALALQHRQIPPTPGFRRPNPEIDFSAGPFWVNNELRSWEGSDTPRRAGVSSFGVGGTNVHLVLEEAPTPPDAETGDDRDVHLLTVSARSEAALHTLAAAYARDLENGDHIADVCFTANTGREHHDYRAALIAGAREGLQQRLLAAAASAVAPCGAAPPRVAALFGPESQGYSGMGDSLAKSSDAYRAATEECDVLFRAAAEELSPGLADEAPSGGTGDVEGLVRRHASVFAAQWSMTQLWMSLGVSFDFVCGLGVGEITAACVAGVFAPRDAMRLVVARALRLAAAAPSRGEFGAAIGAVRFGAPNVPIASPRSAAWVGAEVSRPDYWISACQTTSAGLADPRWLSRQHADVWLEAGPGELLVKQLRRADPASTQASFFGGLLADTSEWRIVLEPVGRMYELGASIAWKELDRGRRRRRVRLAGYPFERRRCWVEPARREAEHARAEAYEIAWRDMPEAPPGKIGARRWLVLTDAAKQGSLAVAALERAGHTGALAVDTGEFRKLGQDRYEVDSDGPQAITRVLAEAASDGVPFEGVLLATGEPSDAPGRMDPAVRAGSACRRLLHAAQAVASFDAACSPKLVLLTCGSEYVISEDRVDPAQAALAGAFRSVALEHPDFEGLHLDLDGREVGLGRTAAWVELASSSALGQVALRAGKAYVRRLIRSAQAAGESSARLHHDRAYWITGGEGALGQLTARRLIKLGAKHVVLTSRGQSRPRDLEQTLEDLRPQGANLVVMPGDVTDPAAVRALLARIDTELPPLAGVIHAAGAVDDGLLIGQTWARCEQVLAPKVAGAWNLHEATCHRPLDHFVMFSSAAAWIGSPSQFSYAGANSFLDGLALHRRALGLPAVSLAWGPWLETGMAGKAGPNPFMRQGLGGITPPEGLDQFERALGGRSPQVAVLAIDWEKLTPRASGGIAPGFLDELRPSGGAAPGEPAAGAYLTEISRAQPSERRRAILAYLSAQTTEFLQLPPGGTITADAALVDFGLDSLSALALRNEISHHLNLKLPAALLYAAPTLEDLAAYVEAELFPGEPPARASSLPGIAEDPEDAATAIQDLTLAELTCRLEARVKAVLEDA